MKELQLNKEVHSWQQNNLHEVIRKIKLWQNNYFIFEISVMQDADVATIEGNLLAAAI